MDQIFYFSYGSNMSTARLRSRIPSAEPICIAHIYNHRLKFHKKSKDGSGKCDAECTNVSSDIVYGVVFRVPASEKSKLDKLEGLGTGYAEKKVSVVTSENTTIEAMTYYATCIDSNLRPYDWYKEHVIRGAREHGLPSEYISAVEAVNSVRDPNRNRHEKELSIY